ncbi:hypothetical protein CGC58_02545 [Capnocytophaga stomatis]|uniref:TonB C-terminal domain-containing protein n=2 Tax=Capnocytophaga stomatis TaxID=1848904 RepID=A0A250FUM4_9FLAO|nr:hypothetical protein CGC58_02545 [Capnocytophaga stomatis]
MFMKNLLFIIALSIISFQDFYAQETSDLASKEKEEKVYDETRPLDSFVLFTSCENVSRKEQEQCFKRNLDRIVETHFKYPEEAAKSKIQGRVNVTFRINTDGSITILDIYTRHKEFEYEARRIFSFIPKLIPARQDGKKVPLTFTYPIIFKL